MNGGQPLRLLDHQARRKCSCSIRSLLCSKILQAQESGCVSGEIESMAERNSSLSLLVQLSEDAPFKPSCLFRHQRDLRLAQWRFQRKLMTLDLGAREPWSDRRCEDVLNVG